MVRKYRRTTSRRRTLRTSSRATTPRRRRRVTKKDLRLRRGINYGIIGGAIVGGALALYSIASKYLPIDASEVFPPNFTFGLATVILAVSATLYVAQKRGLFGPEKPKRKRRRRTS